MILLTFFSLTMISFGLIMAIKPIEFSAAIISFSQKTWFHRFEVVSRLIFGVSFLALAPESSQPAVMYTIAGILLFATVFLLAIGEQLHKAFALKISIVGKHFRLLGVIAIGIGSVLASIAVCGLQKTI